MKKLRLIVAAAALTVVSASALAREITVSGKVSTIHGDPIFGVVITDSTTKKWLTTTNDEGRYSLQIEDLGTLKFEGAGLDMVEVPVNSRMIIDVTMDNKQSTMLKEVTVQGAAPEVIAFEDAEIEFVGDSMRFMATAIIPHKLLKQDYRVVLQPSVYNDTKRKLTYIRPYTFDGRRYDITQRRMLDWNEDADPLNEFKTVKDFGGKEDLKYVITDMVAHDGQNDAYVFVTEWTVEDYNKVRKSFTAQIAHGATNPFRFLRFNLDAYEMEDERYLPQPIPELRDTEGDVNLTFAVGKSTLDPTLGNNAAELESLLSEIRVIEESSNMTLKEFTISGTSSPEGRYNSNMTLANNRVKSAMDLILSSVSEGLRRGVNTDTKASVAPWSDVVALMQADSLADEADALNAIIDRYPGNIDAQSAAARQLPFYKSVISGTYLPRLRRVHYRIVTSQLRVLTEEEIENLYATDYKQLSRYDFWRLYKKTSEVAKKEEVMRSSLEVYPDFTTAATDLSVLLIKDGRADDSVLFPFFDGKNWMEVAKFPEETRYAMAVSALYNGSRYTFANRLMETLPDEPKYEKARMYAKALNGDYQESIPAIAADSPVNEVLMLLKIKSNQLAWEKAQLLGGSAEEEYIKAMAGNRLSANDDDIYDKALSHLRRALELDPELRQVAELDSDVNGLLDDLDYQTSHSNDIDSTNSTNTETQADDNNE